MEAHWLIEAKWATRPVDAGRGVAWRNVGEDDRQAEPFVAHLVEAFLRRLAPAPADDTATYANYPGLRAKAALLAITSEPGRRNRPIAVVFDDRP